MPYPYIPPYQQMMQYSQPTQTTGNFVSVSNEMMARNYPIAPGNSVTFIDENSPYCYTKTMGLNQLDRPVFKRYRLVEEPDAPQNAQNAPQASGQMQTRQVMPDEVKADIEALRSLYEELKLDVEIMKEDISNGKSTVSATGKHSAE